MPLYQDHNGVTVENLLITSSSTAADPSGSVDGHFYLIEVPGGVPVELMFQNGAVKEHGVNGITSEALLAALIHRTKVLDAAFPCEENKAALLGLQQALVNFEVRTARRMVRGVEGLSKA